MTRAEWLAAVAFLVVGPGFFGAALIANWALRAETPALVAVDPIAPSEVRVTGSAPPAAGSTSERRWVCRDRHELRQGGGPDAGTVWICRWEVVR